MATKGDFIYSYYQEWHGEDVCESVTVRLFADKKDAIIALNKDAKESIKFFKENFYDDYWEDKNPFYGDTHILIADNDEYHNWWEGVVEQLPVE